MNGPMLTATIHRYRLLLRLSYGRLFDTVLASREIDAVHYVIWGGTLVGLPPMFYAVKAASVYPYIVARSENLLRGAILADRLFFVVWAILTATLFVTIVWDGLLPDRVDQRILGVLPVNSRTVALARAHATLVSAAAFVAATSAPAAVVHALGSSIDPSMGFPPIVFAGQLLACTLAGAFTACTLIAVRAGLALIVKGQWLNRMAVVLQLVSVVALVEAFLFLPAILSRLLGTLLSGGRGLQSWIPATWFFALICSIAGPDLPAATVGSAWALAATALAVAAAGVAYVLPAPSNAKRVIEMRAPRTGPAMTAALCRIGDVGIRSPVSRAIFAFIVIGLARSRRHLLILATYLGLGIAVGGVTIISSLALGRRIWSGAPTDYLLSLPLVLMFCTIGGFRSAFAMPTDIRANWAFRMASQVSSRACAAAVRATLLLLVVVPTSALCLTLGYWMWGGGTAGAVVLMSTASGIALSEVAAADCVSIPFTRPRGALPSSIKTGVLIGFIGLQMYAFALGEVELWALRIPLGPWLFTAAMLASGLAGGRLIRVWRPMTAPTFEAPVEREVLALNLPRAAG